MGFPKKWVVQWELYPLFKKIFRVFVNHCIYVYRSNIVVKSLEKLFFFHYRTYFWPASQTVYTDRLYLGFDVGFE